MQEMAAVRYLSLFLVSVAAGAFLVSSAVGQKHTFKAVVDNDGVQRVDVLAGEYFFNPDHIVVKANVPVELSVRKEPSIVPHNFVIKAPEAGMDVLQSIGTDPKSIKFTPTMAGNYAFYCDKKLLFFESHRKKGMEGVIEVVE